MKTDDVHPQGTSQIGQHEFDIDFHALIDLLCNFLYKDKSAAIRELLSNANDSLIICKREIGFGNQEPAIRLWLDPQAAQLVVKDNGIGMSKDELMKYLATIGASLTKKKKQALSEQSDPFTDLIGRFGIGFLSSFIVAERIVVETRRPDGPGHRWESRGDKSYTIEDCPDADVGTKAVLDLKAEVRKEWDAEKVKKMVLENARNFVFPIYWGPVGKEKLNNLQAPWYTEIEMGDEGIEAIRNFLTEYDDRFATALNADEIIPLRHGTIRGVVYIPPVAAIQQEKMGVVDLYSKRVFVKKDDTDIAPREFPFIKGIVDCANFVLNAARDDVLRNNLTYRSVVEFIGIQIMEHFCDLANRARRPKEGDPAPASAIKPQRFRLRLQSIMDQFHLLIKHALVLKTSKGSFGYDDHYVSELVDFIPFKSSTHGSTTIPEYLTRMQATGRDKQILILRADEDFPAQRAISVQEKREFIAIQHSVEEEYLERYAKMIGATCISAAEALKDSFRKLEATDGWDQIIRFYQERLSHPEFALSVHLADFQPHSVPGRMLADKDSEGQRQIQELIKDLEKRGILEGDPLSIQLKQLRQKRPHFLFVNKRNSTLASLAAMLQKGPDPDLDIILHDLFHDIAIAAGHDVPEDHLTGCQTKAYGKILEGIEAGHQVNSLRVELAKCLGTTSSTNEVFFIRPMKEGHDDFDFISKQIGKICNDCGLKLIDPKALKLPGEILKEIVDYLKRSRLVIGDVSEENPNIYYEVGYVSGTFAKKLILIASKTSISRGLPFDIQPQRVLGYSRDAEDFEKFVEDFKNVIKEMTATNRE